MMWPCATMGCKLAICYPQYKKIKIAVPDDINFMVIQL